MNPLLADQPAAPSSAQPSSAAPAPAASNGTGAEPPKLPPVARRTCANCGATLVPGQEWCLQCGAGAPDSLATERDWRPLAGIAAVTALLLAGAGTAAYAALSQEPTKPPAHVLIAQVPAPTTSTAPGSTLSAPTTPTMPSTTTPAGTGAGSSKLGLPSSTPSGAQAIRPPKLPAAVPTPSASTPIPHTSTPLPLPTHTTTTPAATTPATTPPPTSTTPAVQTPNPILLDTDAASVYNPSGYPASYFGDPSLAIDGETDTAWTVQLEPKVAPLMAAGLALDFKTATKLGTLEVLTPTPGLTVEVFGANGHTLPATITDPAWTNLARSHVLKKKRAIVKLHTDEKAYRFIVLWLTRAPASLVGTPEAPGHVSIDEVVPYPPATK